MKTNTVRMRMKPTFKDKLISEAILKPIIWLILKHPRVWPLLIKYLRKKLPVAGVEKFFDIISGLNCKAIIIEDAGFGMDMDLLEDYDRLARFVSKTKNVPINNETKKIIALQ